MPYSLKPGRAVAVDLRRVVAKQIACTLSDLTSVLQTWNSGTIHEARRHLKKARAAFRLIDAPHRTTYRAIARALRRSAHDLAPISDADAIRHLADNAAIGRHLGLDRHALDVLRRHLDEQVQIAHRHALEGDIGRRLTERLAKTRQRVQQWRCPPMSIDDVAARLERAIRRSRRQMARARRLPTSDTFHDWRRRVKDHWLQLRLLNRVCGGHLSPQIVRLEQLDDALGRCHDLALLAQAVMNAGLERSEAARSLRSLRVEERRCRREAFALARTAYRSNPRATSARVSRRWRDAAGIGERHSCLRVA